MEHNKQKKPRPIYLNLFKLRLPIGGIVSIVHRMTGVALVLALIPMFYFLDLSLQDETSFRQVMAQLESTGTRLALFVIFILLIQHLFSGIRHLILDMDLGLERNTARLSAWLSFLLTIITGVVAGVCWW